MAVTGFPRGPPQADFDQLGYRAESQLSRAATFAHWCEGLRDTRPQQRGDPDPVARSGRCATNRNSTWQSCASKGTAGCGLKPLIGCAQRRDTWSNELRTSCSLSAP